MGNRVTFYDGGCADCQKVAAFFSAHGVDYDRKNLKTNPSAKSEAIAKGAKTFPAVWVGTTLVEGWNEAKLKQNLGL